MTTVVPFLKLPQGTDVGARSEGLSGSLPGSAVMGRLVLRAGAMLLPAPPLRVPWLLQTDMPPSSPAKLDPGRPPHLFETQQVGLCGSKRLCT